MTVAVVLAGGLGTRLQSVVSDVPKPMASVRGRPFLAHLLDYWLLEGVSRFIFSVGYKYEVIQTYFGSNYKGVAIDYAIEHKPLGTGGALYYCAKNLKENFLLLNGDTFFEVNLQDLLSYHDANEAAYTMCVFQSTDTKRYTPLEMGVDHRILSFRAQDISVSSSVNGGVGMINPRLLELPIPTHRPMSFEGDWLSALLPDRLVAYAMHCEGSFVDIGIPSDYLRAENILP
jgi:D-glycero-alpha-D-manno-heptose 1-phosphate guanylyltransferase